MDFCAFKNNFLKKEVIEFPNHVTPHPVVSVLVQTYQHEFFIKDCLEAILSQETNFDFEILVGEDDSRDKTREICKELAREYPDKIRLFLHHRENQKKILGNPTSNFNAFYNFYSARGEYYAFCEGDDIWTDPTKLQIQIDFLRANPEYVLAYHSFITINSEGELIQSLEEANQPKKDIEKQELSTGVYHPLLQTVCFKKLFSEIPREMIEVINVDTFLFAFLGNYGKAKYMDYIKPSKYRKHPGGIWSSRMKEQKLLSKIITFSQLEKFHLGQKNINLSILYRKKLLNHYKMLLLRYFKKGDLKSLTPLLLKFFAVRLKNSNLG